MSEPVLTVRGLSKAFGGRVVVEDLDLDVAAGEVVSLVGPNGVGKTTVLRCIVGVEAPDAGRVRLRGEAFRDTDPATRRDVCALLDDGATFPDLTVAEHLDLHARAHAAPDPEAATDAALEALRIDHVADQLPETLSSGQTQRLALAQALVRPWGLLIADEPEQRLDVAGREWLGRYLAQSAAAGRAVLLASHDPTVLSASGARQVELHGDV